MNPTENNKIIADFLGQTKMPYEFPLPNSIIIKEYGTTGWAEYFKNKKEQL
jgi:hypothetical protein